MKESDRLDRVNVSLFSTVIFWDFSKNTVPTFLSLLFRGSNGGVGAVYTPRALLLDGPQVSRLHTGTLSFSFFSFLFWFILICGTVSVYGFESGSWQKWHSVAFKGWRFPLASPGGCNCMKSQEEIKVLKFLNKNLNSFQIKCTISINQKLYPISMNMDPKFFLLSISGGCYWFWFWCPFTSIFS